MYCVNPAHVLAHLPNARKELDNWMASIGWANNKKVQLDVKNRWIQRIGSFLLHYVEDKPHENTEEGEVEVKTNGPEW